MAGCLSHWQGLPSEQRFVGVGVARHDDTIGGNSFSRLDDKALPRNQRLHANEMFCAVTEQACFVGQHAMQLGNPLGYFFFCVSLNELARKNECDDY